MVGLKSAIFFNIVSETFTELITLYHLHTFLSGSCFVYFYCFCFVEFLYTPRVPSSVYLCRDLKSSIEMCMLPFSAQFRVSENKELKITPFVAGFAFVSRSLPFRQLRLLFMTYVKYVELLEVQNL